MSQLAEVPSQVRIKKPLKDKFRTTHDIHRPAVKMGKCQKLTYLQMASSNPVPCRGIIQTVVFVGIYWTGYGGCTQPAWPPFGVTNTNTIFNKHTCRSFTNMNTVYHNIHLHCTHWSSWRTVLPFLSITNEYVENGYCRFLFIEELKAGSQIGCWITRIMICQKKTALTRLIAWVTGHVRPKALCTNAKKQWEIWPKIKSRFLVHRKRFWCPRYTKIVLVFTQESTSWSQRAQPCKTTAPSLQ